MKPKLIVEQKITPLVNKYRIFSAKSDGSKDSLLAFVQQKRLAFREKVTFYSDEAKGQVIFTLRAEKILDIHGNYLVEDDNGQIIGKFKKDFAQSLINSTWNILDKNGNSKLNISESNQTLAILRRFGGFIPYFGDLVEIITTFFKYHFVLKDAKTGQIVGKYQKTKLIRDHYLLSMDDDIYSQTDWRVFAAVAVALDALQSR